MTTSNTRVGRPALTPDFINVVDHAELERAQKARIEELSREVRKLRASLEFQKRMHTKVERVMAKYVELLEKQLEIQREAVELLGAPLVPNPLEKK